MPTEASAGSLSRSAVRAEDLSCPICLHLLLSPVTLSCGHTFCAHCASRWGAARACAVCRERLRGRAPAAVNYVLAQ
eukprot:scaffold23095_cov35-Tisochrysis_lutea.AAC.5